MLKKLLTLMLVLVGALTLAGCNPDEEVDCDETPDHVECVVEKNDLEKLTEALDNLSLPTETSTDLVLPSTGLHDVVITWVSDNTDVIANDGTVTIPLFSEGDQTVKITATLTLGEREFTKDYNVTVKAATVETDQEKADNAIVSLLLPDSKVTMDVTLVSEHQTYAVTWTTDNDMYIAADGTVTRPSSDTGNVTVTLTATLTVGTATATKTFELIVQAEEAATVYNTITDLYTSATYNDYVEFTGTVILLVEKGYFMTDGTNVLSVYINSTDLGVAIGDEVKVRGSYVSYNTLYQIGYVDYKEVLSSGNANPITATPEVKTVAELLALDSSVKTIHGTSYTVTATLTVVDGDLFLVDGDNTISITYYSQSASLDALEAYAGQEITVTVFYYAEHGERGPMVAYFGDATEVVVSALPDDQALATDIDNLELPEVTVSSITLPTEGVNGTTFTNWASDNTAILDNDGTFVALGTETTVVTFTATATKGDLTETVTITVVVPILSTVQEVLDMEDDDLFYVKGIVFDISAYGLFIEDNGAYIFVFSKDYDGPVVVGDEIEMVGARDTYSGLAQVSLRSEMTVLSSSNDLPTAVASTVSAVDNDLVPRGTIATITGTVSIEPNQYGSTDVYLTDSAGGKVKVYYKSNADELEGFENQIITVTVITYHYDLVLYKGLAADATVETSFAEAYTAQAVADKIKFDNLDNLNADLTLPSDDTNVSATITWSSSDPTVITDAGEITMVSGSNPTATLTASIVVGSTTVTRTFEITLMDLDENVPMTVTEALAEADGTEVLVKGVIIGEYYGERVIQDESGAALWVDTNVYGDVGDEIVVVGTLSTYTSHSNNNRQLDNATKLETLSTGNDLVLSTETVLTNIFAEKHLMKRYTATFTITSLDDGYGYVLFNTVPVTYYEEDGTTVDEIKDEEGFKLKKSDYAPFFEDLFIVGDTVEVTFTAFYYSFNNVNMSFAEITLTDAQKLAAAQASVEVSASATDDLTLPTEMYGVTIAWATDNAAIGTDGTVTRPGEGELDATVTLTATFTIGTETPVDVPFTVTVPAIPAPFNGNVEDFSTTSIGSSYTNGNFTNNGVTWTYTASRDDAGYQIDGNGIMLRRTSDSSNIVSSTITGGISYFKVSLLKGFTGSGNRQVRVTITHAGGTEVVDSIAWDNTDVQTLEITGLNITGDFTILIENITEKQVIVDDISWSPNPTE